MLNFLNLLDKSYKSKFKKVAFLGCLNSVLDLFALYTFSFLLAILVNYEGEKFLKFENFFEKFFFFNDLKVNEKLLIIFFIFFLFCLIRFIYSIFFSKKIANLFYDLKIFLTKETMTKILNLKYRNLKKFNKSDFVRSTLANTDIILTSAYTPLINFFSDFVSLIPIISLIIYINFKLFFLLLILVSLLFLIYKFFFKSKIYYLGKDKLKYENMRQRYITDYYSSLIQILINKTYLKYLKKPLEETKNASRTDSEILFFQLIPRYIIEFTAITIFVLIFFILSYLFTDEKNVTFTLAIYAVASLRLLPILNRLLISYQALKYSSEFVKKTLEIFNYNEIDIKEENLNSVNLEKIDIKNISFNYEDKTILENLSLQVTKGEIILISGKSGSGKTTLVEIIMGLLEPDFGEVVFLDGRQRKIENINQIQNSISYMPQETYLVNDTIKENILLGTSIKTDETKLFEVLKKSEIINELKLNVIVANGGDNLSGGQKQRIGMARALIKKPNILVLDEPTSSLDLNNIEKIKLNLKILKKDHGIVLISHDIEHFKDISDRILIIENKKLKVLK